MEEALVIAAEATEAEAEAAEATEAEGVVVVEEEEEVMVAEAVAEAEAAQAARFPRLGIFYFFSLSFFENTKGEFRKEELNNKHLWLKVFPEKMVDNQSLLTDRPKDKRQRLIGKKLGPDNLADTPGS